MTIYNREDSRTVLPQLEQRVKALEKSVEHMANRAGSVREFTAWSKEGNGSVQLQIKRTRESSLMFVINDNGILRLVSVPYVDGKDDWSHSTTVWSVDMTNL